MQTLITHNYSPAKVQFDQICHREFFKHLNDVEYIEAMAATETDFNPKGVSQNTSPWEQSTQTSIYRAHQAQSQTGLNADFQHNAIPPTAEYNHMYDRRINIPAPLESTLDDDYLMDQWSDPTPSVSMLAPNVRIGAEMALTAHQAGLDLSSKRDSSSTQAAFPKSNVHNPRRSKSAAPSSQLWAQQLRVNRGIVKRAGISKRTFDTDQSSSLPRIFELYSESAVAPPDTECQERKTKVNIGHLTHSETYV